MICFMFGFRDNLWQFTIVVKSVDVQVVTHVWVCGVSGVHDSSAPCGGLAMLGIAPPFRLAGDRLQREEFVFELLDFGREARQNQISRLQEGHSSL